jgi:(p)ppGpp synthase/HD superfamily hydrolase
MKDTDRRLLEALVLAPYIQKATALIGTGRRCGGNQFRHSMATLAILIDYGCYDPILLKAAVIHDLFEDFPDSNPEEIRSLDEDGPIVVETVFEVTRREPTKSEFLARVRDSGSLRARLLKVADRISNLTDLHLGVFDPEAIERYLDETEEFVLPMAESVAPQMAVELRDLIQSRRRQTLVDITVVEPASSPAG